MIIGTGFDLTALPRIKALLLRYDNLFLKRILTPKEQERLPISEISRVAYVASRFAAKEAAVKALGTGFTQGIGFHDLEVLTLPSGRPMLSLHGQAEKIAQNQGVTTIHLTISHERDVAGAVVILEQLP